MKQNKTQKLESLKTLDEIKMDLLDMFHASGALYQKDITKATQHLDLSDDDNEELFDWLSKNDIEIAEEDDLNMVDPAMVLEDDLGDFDGIDDIDDDYDDGLASDIESLEQSFANSTSTKINDPVKMYLKEID